MGRPGARPGVAVTAAYAWMDRALCVGADPEIWFAGNRRSEAKRICAACPVIDACRAAGDAEYRGVWGGEVHMLETVPGSRTAPYLDEHGTQAGYVRHLKARTPPCVRCTIAHRFANREREQRKNNRKAS